MFQKRLNLFKQRLVYLLSNQNRNKPKVDDTSIFNISLILFFKGEKRRIDLDNLIKPVLDSFNGLVYKDDTQIFKLTAEKKYNEVVEGIFITIRKLTH